MSAVRGFLVGSLALIGLEVLSRNTDRASGALGVSLNLFRAALSPEVPAIHYKGHWGASVNGDKSTTQNTVKGGAAVTDLGPAHATVIAGLQQVTPQAPQNA